MGGMIAKKGVKNPHAVPVTPPPPLPVPRAQYPSASGSLEETLNDYLKKQHKTEEDRDMIVAYYESLDSSYRAKTGRGSGDQSPYVTCNPAYVSTVSYDPQDEQVVLSVATYNQLVNGSSADGLTTNRDANDYVVLTWELYNELFKANSSKTGSRNVVDSQTTGSPTSTESPKSTVAPSRLTEPSLENDDTTNVKSDGRELLQKLTEAIRCPLCQKFFDSPRTLPTCQHSFCHRCIVSYIRFRSMESNNSMQCPRCGQDSDLPPGGVGNLDTDESIRIFMCEMQAQAARRSFPENWFSAIPNNTSNRRTSRMNIKEALNSTSPEYKSVEENARKSAQDCISEIVSIHRIQNVHLYQMYAVQRTRVIDNQPRDDNKERMLWHGTKSSNVDAICRRGFNRAYAGQNAARFGKGTYFAVNFNYSATDSYARPETASSLKSVFQCRVLVGDYTTGSEELVVPPCKPGSTELFDSVVDDVRNPQMFIVFHDAVAYPEYLITFRARR